MRFRVFGTEGNDDTFQFGFETLNKVSGIQDVIFCTDYFRLQYASILRIV